MALAGTSSWPVARTYTGADRVHISLPLAVSHRYGRLWGRASSGTGSWRTTPPRPHRPLTFFACRTSGQAWPLRPASWRGRCSTTRSRMAGRTRPAGRHPALFECVFETTYRWPGAPGRPGPTHRGGARGVQPFCPGGEAESSKPLAIFRVNVRSTTMRRRREPHVLRRGPGGPRPEGSWAPEPAGGAAPDGPAATGILLRDEEMGSAAEEWGLWRPRWTPSTRGWAPRGASGSGTRDFSPCGAGT